MRQLISEKIQGELMPLLQEQRSIDLLQSLMNVVYKLINDHVISKTSKDENLDIDKYINVMLYSSCCIILKVNKNKKHKILINFFFLGFSYYQLKN